VPHPALTDEQRNRLDAWVRLVAPRALAYARSLLNDANRAEDVVQECLYRLLRRATEYDLERDGIRLLFRAITNLSINVTTRERGLASLDTGGDEGEAIPIEDRLAKLPHEVLVGKEMQAAVAAALEKLPPMQRAALELRALGQGKAQIAEILEVSESNAGVLVYRARQTLAEKLKATLGE
jgi:RNA polymerase sigma-70 factor (ECF subfamily)